MVGMQIVFDHRGAVRVAGGQKVGLCIAYSQTTGFHYLSQNQLQLGSGLSMTFDVIGLLEVAPSLLVEVTLAMKSNKKMQQERWGNNKLQFVCCNHFNDKTTLNYFIIKVF